MNLKTTFIRHLQLRLSLSQFALIAGLLCPSIVFSQNYTSSNDLIGATQGFLEQNVEQYLQRSGIQGRHEIQVNNLDPRLRLNACDSPLLVTLENSEQPIGRVTTRVRCESPAPWTIFVPAQVRLYREVLVASKPLQRNQLLSPSDVQFSERDVSQLGKGYLSEIDQVQGLKLSRPLQADQILSNNYLTQAEVIRKGDQVVISARTGSISVKMPGEALSDGSPGQQIRVRNLRSQRIIPARVTGPGLVEVQM